MDGKADDADGNFRALIFALLALACGHMLSTLLRTIPAISLDVMAADFATPPQTLATLERLCDMRIPLSLSIDDCTTIADVIAEQLAAVRLD